MENKKEINKEKFLKREKQKIEKIYEFDKEDLILRDLLAADRTILANERTFLSYLRTFISLVIAGCTIIKLSSSIILLCAGIFLIILGIVIGIHGFRVSIKIGKNLKQIKTIKEKYKIN
ncbi:DUF202 domain-containing protein [Clostridium fallax]|uniref:Putative membrane protein n=1 Tax=Clostridium fallax TaxID=1533 RepID=A0A1M4SUX3_9CLOT|nr:DUF202 domain-containing protein [Clostridium fallax]SHE35988.1 putative membrane protein [Clostridium fallax]SQB07984.1 Predicted membrane protein [Clostridium fallax]